MVFLQIFTKKGVSQLNIDFDKFIGLIVFCAVESKYLIEGVDDYFRKV